MTRMRWLTASFLPAWALVLGCFGGDGMATVRGEVTLDGEPLPEGTVRFVPIDGKTGTASALIENGKFTERVPINTHRVEISSPKLPKGITASRQLKRGTIDEGSALEERIPARYNSKSELKAEVKSGMNEVRFDLKSTPTSSP